MKLGKIVQSISQNIGSAANIEITGIAYDSRAVKPGYLFIAIRGFETDGHKYIQNAIENGAAAVIGESDAACDCPYIKCEDSRRAMALAAAEFYGHPERRLKIIGITGTNGKTTTTYLIKQILNLKGERCDLIGTNHIIVGEDVRESIHTTPESLDLFRLFSEMAESGGKYVVMEVSSHSLALERVYGIEFETAVITNITRIILIFIKPWTHMPRQRQSFSQ